MASSSAPVAAEQPTTEVFPWLKTLPLAPEYNPTLAEFEDPIAYIFKIETEASKYGICKIVPPVAAPPKKTAIANLNRSLSARSTTANPKSPPTFTTRQQQIGFCPRKHRPVQKPVWQSGENYTFPQFEAKAKGFERNYLKKFSKKGLSALEVETLYWKAFGDKPFSVEYANDMPGSAFAPVSARKKDRETGEAVTNVGETAWNMRGVSRAKGSLLRFMKEEIPGVTSPMVYLAMMFSWFAWHVEDHDLHSLNYMHMGAGKTWYGVPREAAVAFEEVIRVHGYGGEINPLVTFAILGEKTTVMSPEVLISAGIPCCRLVQNAGEFVVTFPRAYHSGFSHGFNCGEAANIATPGWLRVAKDAAIRRAAINCPPMVSHFQLLYDLALSLCSRIPKSIDSEPRSSRLKHKRRGEGETLIKKLFVEDVMKNNDLLHILAEGSSIVLLPQNSLDDSVYSNSRIASRFKGNSSFPLGLCNPEEEFKVSESLGPENLMLDRKGGIKQLAGFYAVKGEFSSACDGNRSSLLHGSDDSSTLASQTHKPNTERERTIHGHKLSDQGLFSCVTCGILSFACVAIVQPKDSAARYLMSADCGIFNDGDVGPRVTSDANFSGLDSCSGWVGKSTPDGLFDVPIQSADHIQTVDQSPEVLSDPEIQKGPSALGLLALAYSSSDSEDEEVEADIPVYDSETISRDCSPESRLQCDDDTRLPSVKIRNEATGCHRHDFGDDVPLQVIDSWRDNHPPSSNFRYSNQVFDCSAELETDNIVSTESDSVGGRLTHKMKLSAAASNGSPVAQAVTSRSNTYVPSENTSMSFAPKSGDDSYRPHVFCLQHAAEVEQQLRPIGGSHILLLCHPDYPELEAEAKLVAEELAIDYFWNDIAFREATKEDEESIQTALESEEGTHGNGDWAVKLGINLFYSANLGRSPLYSKQMPYNSIIYKAFGRNSLTNSPTKPKFHGKGSGRQKKIVVAGKWCGKVWMSNQVHPLLVERDAEEGEEDNTSFRGWAKPEVKHERLSESARPAETNFEIRKIGKKRKNTCQKEGGPIKKSKCTKVEDSVKPSDASPEGNQQYSRNFRNLRNKQLKLESPQPQRSSDRNKSRFDSFIEDALEGGPSTRLRKRTSKLPVEDKLELKKHTGGKKAKKCPTGKMRDGEEGEYPNDMEPVLKRHTASKKAKKGPTVKMRDEEEGEYASDVEPVWKRHTASKRTKKGPIGKMRDEEGGEYPSDEELVWKRHTASKRTKKGPIVKMRDEEGGYPSDEEPVWKRHTASKRAKKGPTVKMRAEEEGEYPSDEEPVLKKHTPIKKAKKGPTVKMRDEEEVGEEGEYPCDVEGCTMSFVSKQELVLHKRNICPVKGCGKKFFSHKYLVQHRRVHMDDRPLKCPWKGCKMAFKWAWARTEHIRVHTGARPYVCAEEGCGQTFRFVSDFSRHKRKTGHSTKKGRG
ncbi:lysine-specific demethylase REF6-like [Actinidia eriantha]|uniref:lysine-specific demethylase REF6-like n=1 Tax=Actinidia eriantha TaxID=165200 RepID=UPI002585A48A|nr:lysine-specific demethylase REF6-like [Actinidia eriantha]